MQDFFFFQLTYINVYMGVEQVELFTKTIRVTSIDMESYAMIHQLLLSKVLENELQGKLKQSKGRFFKVQLK